MDILEIKFCEFERCLAAQYEHQCWTVSHCTFLTYFLNPTDPLRAELDAEFLNMLKKGKGMKAP